MGGSGHILVLDAGSSGMRSLVFDERGRIVGRRAAEWSYLREEDVPELARAFDPQAQWTMACRLMTGSIEEAGAEGDVAAVSITSQRQGVVFLDEDGQEIYAGPNLDLRAVFEGAAIDDEMRGQVYETTGHLPSFLFAPAKLRWFQGHRPETYGRISRVLALADWLVWRLTGTAGSEVTLAAEAGLLDVRSRDWCSPLLDSIGVRLDQAPLVQSGTVVGTVRPDLAEGTGLSPGTPVAAAGADTQCGLLGMSVAKPHQVGIVAGWSAPVQMVTDEPVFSPEAGTWTGCFLEAGKWVLESSAGDVGNSYQWLAETFFEAGDGVFDQMDKLAANAPLGSDGTMAVLGPSRMNMASPGLNTGGFLFPVPLTFSALGRGHIVRAAVEAIACALRANLEQVEELAGVLASEVILGGGMTRTRAFVRVFNDVLGRELKVSPMPEATALGAYLCARTAMGEFDSLAEAAESVRPTLEVREPDLGNAAEYQDHYERWLDASDRLKSIGL